MQKLRPADTPSATLNVNPTPLMFASLPLRRGAMFLLLLGLAAWPLAAQTDADLDKLFRQANEKFNAGEHAAAIDLYNQILEQEPQADNVLSMRAFAKSALNDVSGARADIAQVLRLNPKHADAYRLRATIHFQAKDYTASLADLDRSIEHGPNFALSYAMRSQVHVELKAPDKALADLNRAIELDSEQAMYFYERGRVHADLGSDSLALADYSRALRLDPDNADAANNRAWLRFHRHEWAEAATDARRVIELAPDYVSARRVLGYSLFGQADYAAAVKALDEAIAMDKDPAENAYAMFIRHFGRIRLGQPDRQVATAWGYWQDKPWLQAIGRFLAGQIDEDVFEQVAREAKTPKELSERLCEMHYYIGMVRLQAGDKSTARLRFQASVATNEKTFIEYTLAEAELKRL